MKEAGGRSAAAKAKAKGKAALAKAKQAVTAKGAEMSPQKQAEKAKGVETWKDIAAKKVSIDKAMHEGNAILKACEQDPKWAWAPKMPEFDELKSAVEQISTVQALHDFWQKVLLCKTVHELRKGTSDKVAAAEMQERGGMLSELAKVISDAAKLLMGMEISRGRSHLQRAGSHMFA